jgi:type IV pilus assembly protein PilW
MKRSGSPVLSSTQLGMSLIETMVGITLGLVVVLVLTQVWANFEGQKQRSISGATAQESGVLALTQIEQDARSAGAGLSNSALDCTSVYSYFELGATTVSPVPSYSGSAPMAPARIVDGGTLSDQITFKRGDDIAGGIPVTLAASMSNSSAVIDVPSVAGFNDGDVAMVMGAGGNCTVLQITQVMVPALKIQHNPGGAATFNPPTSYRNANGWPAYASGSKIMKVGRIETRTYSVNANNQMSLLDETNPVASVTSILAHDIVRLKAQYGIADAGTQDVNAWVNATAGSGWDALDPVKIKRIKAIRVAVIARSAKLEGENVTGTCTNNAGVNNGPCAWPDTAAYPAPLIDLSADPNWRRYRYRVYQTVIPMRNVIWGAV